MSLMLASLMIAAPSGYATMPIFNSAACKRAKNPGSCRKCVTFKKAYFPNGTCRPMVRANEGGIANQMQCKGQKGLRLNQCNACVQRRFPHRFFPHAAGALRCRYLRGAGPRRASTGMTKGGDAPIQSAGLCHRAGPTKKNQCRNCTRRPGHVYFAQKTGQRCYPSVAKNEGGMRHRNQCRSSVRNVRKKCNTCLANPNMRFFPNAGPGMRCRWVKGSRTATPAKRVATKASDLLTEPRMCATVPKLWTNKCQQCFKRSKGQKVGFVAKGSSSNSCRVLVARNAGGIKTPKLCQAIPNPVARKQCLRCVNNSAWPGAYFAGASHQLRCRHVVSPARLSGKRARPAAQPAVLGPPKGGLPGMAAKPKVSNAAVKAAFANQGKKGMGAKLGVGKTKVPGIIKPGVCLKRFRHNRNMRQACRRCVTRRKPHSFRPGAPKGRRCTRR